MTGSGFLSEILEFTLVLVGPSLHSILWVLYIPLRFGMLKAWTQNQSLAEIEIEERYRTWVANLRTDKYVTVRTLIPSVCKVQVVEVSTLGIDTASFYFVLQVTLFQLQKIYGKSGEAKAFIQELTKGALFAAPAIVTESCFQKSPTTC